MIPSVSPTAEKNKAQFESNKATRSAIRDASGDLMSQFDTIESDLQTIDKGDTSTPL